jgi:hypothetical protein
MNNGNPNNQNPTSSEGRVEVTPETYPDWVIQVTKDALGLLSFEREMGHKNGRLTARDEILFDAAMILFSELQVIASAKKEQNEKGDVLVPSSGLVDVTGKPI